MAAREEGSRAGVAVVSGVAGAEDWAVGWRPGAAVEVAGCAEVMEAHQVVKEAVMEADSVVGWGAAMGAGAAAWAGARGARLGAVGAAMVGDSAAGVAAAKAVGTVSPRPLQLLAWLLLQWPLAEQSCVCWAAAVACVAAASGPLCPVHHLVG